VYTVERIPALAERARATLADLGYEKVHVICGDGSLGWPDAAPYDGIVVTAVGPRVPDSLKHQLAEGGRLVIPVERKSGVQELIRLTRTGDNGFDTESLCDVRFVPLIGEEGWQKDDRRRWPLANL
ncbi:MAG: protein-L-isoaspartate O-methyltransferase family protein, partial [Hyphomicrobiales bacterium]